MRKLFVFAIIMIAPTLAHAQKHRKEKKPLYPIVGHSDYSTNEANFQSFTGTIVVEMHVMANQSDSMYRDTITARGGKDVLVCSRNGNGDVYAYFTVSGPGLDSVACLTDRRLPVLCLSGGYTDTTYIGDSILYPQKEGVDAFFAMVTKEGKVQWTKTWGCNGDDYCLYVWHPGGLDVEVRVRYDVEEGEHIDFAPGGSYYVAPATKPYVFTLRYSQHGRLLSSQEQILGTR